jgi:hypothetical protein
MMSTHNFARKEWFRKTACFIPFRRLSCTVKYVTDVAWKQGRKEGRQAGRHNFHGSETIESDKPGTL